jgi:hypothetical protein
VFDKRQCIVQDCSLVHDGRTDSSDTAQFALIIRGVDGEFNVTEENGCSKNRESDNRDRLDGRIRQSHS